MINKKIEDAFNQQINEEVYSSYFYLAMVAYFENQNLKGFAHWLRIQVQEEMLHGMKFHTHILSRGGNIDLKTIKQPEKQDWESPLQVFEEGLKHEYNITKCIHQLMDLAMQEKDYASHSMLNWFIDEQVEEEENFTELVEKLRMIGDNKAPLLMLDAELAQRPVGPNPFFPTAANGAA